MVVRAFDLSLLLSNVVSAIRKCIFQTKQPKVLPYLKHFKKLRVFTIWNPASIHMVYSYFKRVLFSSDVVLCIPNPLGFACRFGLVSSEGGRPLGSGHEDIRSCRLCGMTSYFYLFLTLWLISLSSYVNHVFEVSINFSVGFQPELELDRAFCGNQLDFHICDVPNSFPSQNSRTIAKWTEPTTEASQTSSWYSIFSFKDTTLSTIITWHPQ